MHPRALITVSLIVNSSWLAKSQSKPFPDFEMLRQISGLAIFVSNNQLKYSGISYYYSQNSL